MRWDRLEQNLCDMVKEEQIKLGYSEETIRLYYPVQSLNRFLETEADADELLEILSGFCETVRERFGQVKITEHKGRFCICLPPQMAQYVHTCVPDSPFLKDFIRAIGTHGASMDEILGTFYRYSERVHVEEIANGEFDVLVYFEDGEPDDYRYLLTNELGHITYHRFTKEDLEDYL